MQRKNTSKGQGSLYSSEGRAIASVLRDSLGRLYALKTISASKHCLRRPAGIAYDDSAIEQARNLGVLYFVVKDRETGQTWWTELWKFGRHGFAVNRWAFAQTGLEFKYWNIGPGPGANPLSKPQDVLTGQVSATSSGRIQGVLL